MSLDLVLMGLDGAPESTASVGVDAHHRLKVLLGHRFPLLGRMSEYYEDASYTPSEVPALRAELTALDNDVASDTELRHFVREALVVLALASDRSCGVEILAD